MSISPYIYDFAKNFHPIPPPPPRPRTNAAKKEPNRLIWPTYSLTPRPSVWHELQAHALSAVAFPFTLTHMQCICFALAETCEHVNIHSSLDQSCA